MSENLPALNESHLKLFGLVEAVKKNFTLTDPPLEHYFADGVYGRQMTISQGELVVGRIHKKGAINVLLSGQVALYSANGGAAQVYKAPCIFVSSAGEQRAIFGISEAVMMCVLATDLKDPQEIFDTLTYFPQTQEN